MTSRETSAHSFLSEGDRIVAPTPLAYTYHRSKMLSNESEGGRPTYQSNGPTQVRHGIYPSRSKQATANLSLQFLPDVRPASPLSLFDSPPATTDLVADRKPNSVIGNIHAANKSDGALQLLRSQPSSDSVRSTLSEVTSHTAQRASRSVARVFSPSSYSSMDSTSLAYRESLPSDPRQFRLHRTSNNFPRKEAHGDIQSYLIKRQGYFQYIPPQYQVESRVPSPLPEDDAAVDQEDDRSVDSSYAPTLQATINSDQSSKTTENEHEILSLLLPKPPSDLPPVDCSPLFTDQEKDTVMSFLKRISVNLSGKQHKFPVKPSSTRTYRTSATSLKASSQQTTYGHEIRQPVNRVSVQEEKTAPRSRMTSSASTVSTLLHSLEPNYSQGGVQGQTNSSRFSSINPIGGATTLQCAGLNGVRRNKTWAPPRADRSSSVWMTWSQRQQKRSTRAVNGISMPPPSRTALLLQNHSAMSLDFTGDGVYRAIMPDLPRSSSLRLASTTSLSAVEEAIRHRQRMESKISLASSTNIPYAQSEDLHKAPIKFPSLASADQDPDEPQPSLPPPGAPLDNASTRTLSTPFLLRPARSQSLCGSKTLGTPTTPGVDEIGQNADGLKSFMDFSADPGIDGPAEKVRNKNNLRQLWKKARAGITLIWGRRLPGKKRKRRIV